VGIGNANNDHKTNKNNDDDDINNEEGNVNDNYDNNNDDKENNGNNYPPEAKRRLILECFVKWSASMLSSMKRQRTMFVMPSAAQMRSRSKTMLMLRPSVAGQASRYASRLARSKGWSNTTPCCAINQSIFRIMPEHHLQPSTAKKRHSMNWRMHKYKVENSKTKRSVKMSEDFRHLQW